MEYRCDSAFGCLQRVSLPPWRLLAAILMVLVRPACALADDARLLIRACGVPEFDFSSLREHPRSPIATRYLDYPGANFRLEFVLNTSNPLEPAKAPLDWRLYAISPLKDGRLADNALTSDQAWKLLEDKCNRRLIQQLRDRHRRLLNDSVQ